ncbi:MAG: 50S ribosomal protein L5 [Candidatus Diapherotrites archaeon]|nr:50S ribosomal protein L5 [Candidatus Diapherotrites archaeon]
MTDENSMRRIFVEKVTLNMGTGNAPEELKKAQQILERISGMKVKQTKCKVKQPKWDIRPGLAIGLKATLRGLAATEFLKKAFAAKDNQLQKKNFDNRGCFGFGIKEYIDLPGTKYDPKLGIRGLDVLVTLKRPGFRVKTRKIKKTSVGKKHLITKEEAIDFITNNFGVAVA